MFHLKSTIVNLERNHVVFVAILFSCQGTDVRERAAILPDPHVRVKRLSFILMKPTRLTRTRLPLSKCCWKDLRARTALGGCLRRLQGPGSVRSGLPFVNYEFCVSPAAPFDCFRAADHAQPVHPNRYSSSFSCTTCCADSSYGLFSKDPVPLRDQQ